MLQLILVTSKPSAFSSVFGYYCRCGYSGAYFSQEWGDGRKVSGCPDCGETVRDTNYPHVKFMG